MILYIEANMMNEDKPNYFIAYTKKQSNDVTKFLSLY